MQVSLGAEHDQPDPVALASLQKVIGQPQGHQQPRRGFIPQAQIRRCHAGRDIESQHQVASADRLRAEFARRLRARRGADQ